jgi:hypothetical protein
VITGGWVAEGEDLVGPVVLDSDFVAKGTLPSNLSSQRLRILTPSVFRPLRTLQRPPRTTTSQGNPTTNLWDEFPARDTRSTRWGVASDREGAPHRLAP